MIRDKDSVKDTGFGIDDITFLTFWWGDFPSFTADAPKVAPHFPS